MPRQSPKLDFELFFLSEVLQLTSLHYGYWNPHAPSDRLDLDEIRRGQTRFREELLSAIPEGVESVLDVGAGIGDSAYEMARRGYDVVAISPDRNHEQYFADDDSVRFECSTFEAFQADSQFDLLYFSESIGYIDREEGLRQSRRLTKPGGHLLVSCTFRSPDDQPYPEDFDLADLEYVKHAQAAGFELVSARDITKNVLPTVQIAHRAMTEYLPPLMEMGKAFYQTRKWHVRMLLKWMLGRPSKTFEEVMAHYYRETNPEHFATRIRYATLLLREAA